MSPLLRSHHLHGPRSLSFPGGTNRRSPVFEHSSFEEISFQKLFYERLILSLCDLLLFLSQLSFLAIFPHNKSDYLNRLVCPSVCQEINSTSQIHICVIHGTCMHQSVPKRRIIDMYIMHTFIRIGKSKIMDTCIIQFIHTRITHNT